MWWAVIVGTDDNGVSTASEGHAQARPNNASPGGRTATLAGRALAMSRYEILAPHLHEEVPLARLAADQGEGGPSYRTLQRWLAGYRRAGLDGLARASRSDKGLRRFPDELVAFVEGLALRKASPQRGNDPPAGRERRQGTRLAGAGLLDRARHRRRPRPCVGHPRRGRHQEVPGVLRAGVPARSQEPDGTWRFLIDDPTFGLSHHHEVESIQGAQHRRALRQQASPAPAVATRFNRRERTYQGTLDVASI